MENIVVFVVVGVVVMLVGWSLYRVLTGKKSGCCCNGKCNVCNIAQL